MSFATQRRRQLAGRSLYVLADGADSLSVFVDRVRVLVQAPIDMIQLRDKVLADRALVERARTLRRLTADSDVLCIVNDRPDIARLIRADGVHVGQEELHPADVRAIVGEEMLVGVSTHSLGQARQAVHDGADYLGVGPVFPSHTKHFTQLAGLRLVSAVAIDLADTPQFAIGGISPANVAQVVRAGASGVAVQSAVWSAPDPRRAIDCLRRELARAVPVGGADPLAQRRSTAARQDR
jgi:thiamine-phosphate pyrophosphorylase